MNIICVIIIIILILGVIFYCFFCKTNNYSSFKITKHVPGNILKAPRCSHSGLGDRLSLYILYSTLGVLYNCKVIVYWETEKLNSSLTTVPIYRNTQYPNDILNYINFPENLIFVSKSDYINRNNDKICPDPWRSSFRIGNEHIPEFQYKLLNLSNLLSFDKYLKLYKETAKKIQYKKNLPTLPKVSNNFTAVHIRRGDKSDNNKITEQFHNQRLNSMFNYLKIDKFVLCSEAGNLIKNKSPIDIQWSEDSKIRVLEEFFILCKASKIIQSSPGYNIWGGWTSFSYIASRIGDTILYNCSPSGTRFYELEKMLGRPLYNVIKYDDIIK